jgi:hypothetical protein
MMGDKIRRRINELNAIKKAKGYIEDFKAHEKRTYPYSEEDNEGVSTYTSSRHVELIFKGITPEEGYKKTINKFKLIGRLHRVRIELVNGKVVVDF